MSVQQCTQPQRCEASYSAPVTQPFENPQPEDLTLSITGVAAADAGADGGMPLQVNTTRGVINALFHPVEGGTGAVVFVGGAMGGVDGPANKIYSRIPAALAERSVSTLRVDYRHPNDTQECVLDVLAACSLLKGIGATDVVLAGHSFGGAVVIAAAELAPIVRGVVSMSPQLHGAERVDSLQVPLLLVHGMADTVLSYEASEDIYRRAPEPKRIVLYAEAGHSLIQAQDEIWDLLLEWIPRCLEGGVTEGGRDEIREHGLEGDDKH